jgi:phospholipase C
MVDSTPKFDHVVVVMFENRSFDDLLGRLYVPGEVPAFEGVYGRDLSNSVPPGVLGPEEVRVPVHPALRMDTPDPDPGEEFPHVNTQLFGTVAPETNRYSKVAEMRPPFNAPADPSQRPTMEGFLADYVHSYRVEMGHLPTIENAAQIMAGYTPEQLPVFSALARGFACFDHWFCEVPSQTFPNRSFFHAASSSGFVVNHPSGKFATQNDAPTIFERLQAAGRSWRVYIDPKQGISVTAFLHARRLEPYFASNFSTVFDFYEHARTGQLADYSFIEPNLLFPPSDMHPPIGDRLRHDLGLPAPESTKGGEALLSRVYESVRTSASPVGSNWENTLLLVTFDEHGGTYDHVPPPPAPPPGDTEREEMGFGFDRSGVRIPAIAISAWIEPRTVVTEEFRSTSVIRTLRERWSLGPALTGRDAVARDIAPVLRRSAPRPPDEWPRVAARPFGRYAALVAQLERPLSHVMQDVVGEALSHEARKAGATAGVDGGGIGHWTARRHAGRIRRTMFPGIARGRRS